MADKKTEEQVKAGAFQTLRTWGENPLPPTLLATLVATQHMRPVQPLPLLFPPALLFSTYMNLNTYKIDSAGFTAALSGLYFVLAQRRKQRFANKFGTRGIIRGATLGLCALNVAGCGVAYAFGNRRREEAERS